MKHPTNQRASALRDLWRRSLADTSGEWLRLLLAGAAACALGLAPPVLVALVFERVIPAGHRGALAGLLLALLALVSATQLADFLATSFRLRLRKRLSLVVKAGMMKHLLSLTTGFHRRFTVGELITQAGIADGEQERLLVSAFTGFFEGAVSVSSLGALFALDARIGRVSLAAGACALAGAAGAGALKLRLERSLLDRSGRVRSFLLQIFSGISTVRVAGAERHLFARWSGLFRQKRALGLATSRISTASAVLLAILPLTCSAVFFRLLGGDDAAAGRMSGGRYLAALATFGLYINGALRLAGAVSDLACAVPLAERSRPLLAEPPERTPANRGPGRLSGMIEVRDVCFRYMSGDPLTLAGLNARIRPGELVALVGPSGSGKSTLVRLLLGFEQPERGQILYDGTPLAALDIVEVRRQIGTVLQHDHLIAGNIHENIAAMRPIAFDQAWEAARIAGLEGDLARLPMGMRSFVTPGGRAFSGGERQRLMIARAVAGKPRLLILDEATSALDNRVQAEVMRNLERLRITRIVVAHRLSTIRHADQILVFDRGRIVERGDFASLLARGGLFSRLADRQVAYSA